MQIHTHFDVQMIRNRNTRARISLSRSTTMHKQFAFVVGGYSNMCWTCYWKTTRTSINRWSGANFVSPHSRWYIFCKIDSPGKRDVAHQQQHAKHYFDNCVIHWKWLCVCWERWQQALPSQLPLSTKHSAKPPTTSLERKIAVVACFTCDTNIHTYIIQTNEDIFVRVRPVSNSVRFWLCVCVCKR